MHKSVHKYLVLFVVAIIAMMELVVYLAYNASYPLAEASSVTTTGTSTPVYMNLYIDETAASTGAVLSGSEIFKVSVSPQQVLSSSDGTTSLNLDHVYFYFDLPTSIGLNQLPTYYDSAYGKYIIDSPLPQLLSEGSYVLHAKAFYGVSGNEAIAESQHLNVTRLKTPANLISTGSTSSSISLQWTNNSSINDKYNIERKLTTDTYWTGAWTTQITDRYTTTYSDTSVAAGTSYDYRVQACWSGNGCGSYTYLIGVYSAAASCTGLTLTLNDGKINYSIGDTVNYTWLCTPGGTASNVSMYLYKPDGSLTLYNYGSGNTQTMGFGTSNLVVGSYILKACFDSVCATVNASQPFSIVSASPTPTPTPTPTPSSSSVSGSVSVPSTPTGLMLSSTQSSSTVSLQWTDNSTNEDRFTVQRKLTSASWSDISSITSYIISQANITTYTDTAATSGNYYDYRVIACLTNVGCSGYSNYLTNITVATASGSISTPTPTPTSTYPYISASFDSVLSSSTIAYPTTVSGSKNVAINSESSFPTGSLSFYIYKLSSDGTTFDTNMNYYTSTVGNISLVSGSQGKNWTGSINTVSIPKGTYKFYAKGYVDGITTGTLYYSNHIYFAVDNTAIISPTPTPVSLAPYISSTIDTVTSTVYTSPTPISGNKLVTVISNTSFAASAMSFYLFKYSADGVVDKTVSYLTSSVGNISLVTTSDGKKWTGSINTSGLTDGNYKFFAKGIANSVEYFSNNVYFKVENLATPSVTPIPASPNIIVGMQGVISGSTISGIKTLKAESDKPLEGISFLFYNTDTKKNSDYAAIGGKADTSYKYWTASTDTSRLANGNYQVVIKVIYDGVGKVSTTPYNIKVSNIVAIFTPTPYPAASPLSTLISKTSPTPAPTLEALVASTPVATTAATTSAAVYMAGECEMKGITSPTECEKYLLIPRLCREANVLGEKECSIYLYSFAMPEICRLKKAATQEECAKIIIANALPEDCKKANITTESACSEFLKTKNISEACLAVKIYDSAECDKFLQIKDLPKECSSIGLLTAETCKTYLFDKYTKAENISIAALPADCSSVNATSSGECAKILRQKYLPESCKNQGLTSEADCVSYLKRKSMPKECQAAGVMNDKDCDALLYSKFVPAECEKAGIKDGKECKDYIFNLYAPKTTCQGIDEFQCKNTIKENYLGSIVNKQAQFAKVDDNITSLSTSGAVSVNELEARMGNDKEIIPIKEGNTTLKIIKAEENLVMDQDKNLIQTGPVAMMVDSDNDGLTDDMEKRIGTDPKKADSDGDGFKDGDEVKGGYNPLGDGKLAEGKIAPVDEAILTNKTLSHPKVEGVESGSYTVNKVANSDTADGNDAKYLFTGKADSNSVVTLYIYSDFPVVVTVKTDKYGNWNYEFDRSLKDGEHEVYVALNDNSGKVVTRSKVMNFFVNEAKAVSVKDFINSSVQVPLSESEKATSNYMVITIAVILVAIIIFIGFLYILRKKNQEPKA